MKVTDLKKYKLPDSPGIYFFLGKYKEILYIGRATSLRDRVKSYFSKDLAKTRGPLIEKMVIQVRGVDYRKLDSVLESMLVEADLIKKFHPEYNTAEKDDKSFNCVAVTKEQFPRVLVVRKKDLDNRKLAKDYTADEIYGPFPEGGKLQIAMRIIRKIFPYRDKCAPLQGKPCFNQQIGLCPGVCNGTISEQEYMKNIQNIRLLFHGKKKTIINSLKTEMRKLAKTQEFEKADKIKKTINSLMNIRDVSLIKEESRFSAQRSFRIESYDVAHISGTSRVGVMTVVEDGSINKNEYRKFKILDSAGRNDVKGLGEILSRRLSHEEWRFPDLIVVDGGVAQKRAAESIVRSTITDPKHWPPIVAVTKDEHHHPKKIIGDPKAIKENESSILLANSESHRFAINYHRKIRRKTAFD